MPKSPNLLLIITLLIFVYGNAFSQRSRKYIPDNERFSAGVIFGLNNAQLDGDYHIGFDKFGLTAGIRGIARFTPRLDLNIEMLYSKKGSKIFPNTGAFQVNPKKSRIIDLTYVDAPIYFKWLLKDELNTWHIELGGVYSRLIKTEITEQINNPEREFVYETVVDDFNKDDIAILAGFGHTWQSGWAIHLRYAFGLTKFYENELITEPLPGSVAHKNVQFLRNYYYSLAVSYTIFQREIKKKRR
ncbi:MAG: outer membrane beta-barrel protein [Bacteroidota bacterium]